MFNAILKKIVPIPKIEDFNDYLFIGPHPDDIEMACAPTIAKLVSQGKRVTFLIATDGRAGTIDASITDCNALVALRKKEALASAKTLGVEDVRFLNFADGGQYSVEELTKALCLEIVKIKPQVVFAPDYTVASECHADHLKVGQATAFTMNCVPFPLFMKEVLNCDEIHTGIKALAFYYTERPNSYVKINNKLLQRRYDALSCHKTQFAPKDLQPIVMYMKLRAVRFGMRRWCGLADGFRTLSPVHMHCFPEASDFKR